MRHAHILVIMTFSAIAACSDQAGGGPLVLITNSWREVGNEGRRFNLNATTAEPADKGEFAGTEVDEEDYDIEGVWSHGRITMTVYRNPVITWRARVTQDEPTTLVFTRTVGAAVDSLVIFRD
jgi:hypothetical protein